MWFLVSILCLAQAAAPDTGAPSNSPAPAAAAADASSDLAKKPKTATDESTAKTPASPEDSAPAETGKASEKTSSWLSDMLHSGAMGYMIDGGIFMWPILMMGILAAGVTIERLRSLKMVSSDTSKLRETVLELLQADRAEEALELCSSQQGPVPAVLTAGLRKYLVLKQLNYDAARIEEQVVKAMEDYSVHIVAALERHLPILSTISSVAPMVGSVGTVTGMIILFKDIVAKMGTTNIIEAAAAGIQVKLLVTVWGLMVGIPAYVAFNYFTTVINRYVLNVEESATELIEAVTLQMSFREGGNRSSADAVAEPGERAELVHHS